MRLALGHPACGLAGFRATHHDAHSAHQIAELRADNDVRVTAFDQIALTSLLIQDLPAARRWITTVLGGLAADDPATAQWRTTVLTYLHTGSLTQTAAQLYLHPNTVRYRLEKATAARGAPLTDHQLELHTALQAHQHLPTLLHTSPQDADCEV